jgi:hypothetical protein
MKKCPKCLADYSDDMTFCLNDGSPLAAASPANFSQQRPVPGDPPPTVWSGTAAPPQNFQQPQGFQQPPNFQQPGQNYQQQPNYQQQGQQYQQAPPFNPQGGQFAPQVPVYQQNVNPPKPKITAGRLILGFLLLIVGVSSIIGGMAKLGLFESSRSTSSSYTNYNSIDSNLSNNKSSNMRNSSSNSSMRMMNTSNSNMSTSGSSNMGNSSSNSSTNMGVGEPSLYESRNGFKRISYSDATSTNLFPGASKIMSALYSSDGVANSTVFGRAGIYSSADEAQTGYDKYLNSETDKGGTITEKGNVKTTRYTYFKDSSQWYHFCILASNQVIDYSANSMATLEKFLK